VCGIMLEVGYCPIIPFILFAPVPLQECGRMLWKEVASCSFSLGATEFA